MSEVLKKPYLSSETWLRLIFYIGAGIFAYATMSSKIEDNIKASGRIEKNLIEYQTKQDKLQEDATIQRDLIKAQISVIQIDVAVLKKQMENDK